jgi:hypothetical protein
MGRYRSQPQPISDETLVKVEKVSLFLAGIVSVLLISATSAGLLMLIIDVFHHRGITTGSLSFWAALKIVIFARLAWLIERAFNRQALR